jgi:hypothetical protein
VPPIEQELVRAPAGEAAAQHVRHYCGPELCLESFDPAYVNLEALAVFTAGQVLRSVLLLSSSASPSSSCSPPSAPYPRSLDVVLGRMRDPSPWRRLSLMECWSLLSDMGLLPWIPLPNAGHSAGAGLAVDSAYDITATLPSSPAPTPSATSESGVVVDGATAGDGSTSSDASASKGTSTGAGWASSGSDGWSASIRVGDVSTVSTTHASASSGNATEMGQSVRSRKCVCTKCVCTW